MPSCETVASRRQPALPRRASVATTARVVAVPARIASASARRSAHQAVAASAVGRGRSANSPSSPQRAPSSAPSGPTADPTALTATRAPTVRPESSARGGRAHAAPQAAGAGARPGAHRAARHRTRCCCRVGVGAVGGPGVVAPVPARPRSKRMAAGTIGTRSPSPSPTGQPRPSSQAASATPSAAPSPNALPPERTTASTASTAFAGSSRSVSRVPGAAAADVDPADGPGWGQDDGDAGEPARLVPGDLTDAHAVDVGDGVEGSGAHRPSMTDAGPAVSGTGIGGEAAGLSAASPAGRSPRPSRRRAGATPRACAAGRPPTRASG